MIKFFFLLLLLIKKESKPCGSEGIRYVLWGCSTWFLLLRLQLVLNWVSTIRLHTAALHSEHVIHHITSFVREICNNNLYEWQVSGMDFLSNLLPAVPSLELDPTNPLQNATLLQNTFIGAFLGTFLGSLAAQTVRNILGESVRICHLIHHNLYIVVSYQMNGQS